MLRLSWNGTVAKREMTGAAALQSYPENRSANLHNGGGSFATVDRAAAFQLSVAKEKKNKTEQV